MKLKPTIKALGVVLALALCQAAQAKNSEIPGVTVKSSTYFYTGKPYDADMGAYTFHYRNYDPKLNRWTSADPSGFPDGTNNNVIVNNNVLIFLDPNGEKLVPVTEYWAENMTAPGVSLGVPLAGGAAGLTFWAGTTFAATASIPAAAIALLGGYAYIEAQFEAYKNSVAAGGIYVGAPKVTGVQIGSPTMIEVPDNWVQKSKTDSIGAVNFGGTGTLTGISFFCFIDSTRTYTYGE